MKSMNLCESTSCAHELWPMTGGCMEIGHFLNKAWRISHFRCQTDPPSLAILTDEESRCGGSAFTLGQKWCGDVGPFFESHQAEKWLNITIEVGFGQLPNLTFCFVLHVSSSSTWAFTSIPLTVTNFFFFASRLWDDWTRWTPNAGWRFGPCFVFSIPARTAQGGGGSFKERKPMAEVVCC